MNHPVSGRPLRTDVIELDGFGRVAEVLDLTGEGFAERAVAALNQMAALRQVTETHPQATAQLGVKSGNPMPPLPAAIPGQNRGKAGRG